MCHVIFPITSRKYTVYLRLEAGTYDSALYNRGSPQGWYVVRSAKWWQGPMARPPSRCHRLLVTVSAEAGLKRGYYRPALDEAPPPC